MIKYYRKNRFCLLGLGLTGWMIITLIGTLGCQPVFSLDQEYLVDETTLIPAEGGRVEISFYLAAGQVIMITLEAADTQMEPYGHLDYPGGWSEYLPAQDNAWAGFNSGGTSIEYPGIHVLTVFDGSNLGGSIRIRVEIVSDHNNNEEGPGEYPQPGDGPATRIIFLHHSTGEIIWNGGVENWFARYNALQGTHYRIETRVFPQDSPYGWENYPYDYWNIWVNQAGPNPYLGEPTLEILTREFQMIVWKHCYPVSNIEPDIGRPDIASNDRRLENYTLQYEALKTKMHQFPDTLFLVWTGAAQVRESTNPAEAQRARQFFDWVRTVWDEPGDNIFIWDFYQLETEGELYVKPDFASGPYDAHPNWVFAERVAPLFSQRIVDILEGRGDAR